AIMGPLLFGTISHAAGGNPRRGILALGAFFVSGLALLARVEGGGPTGRATEERAATGAA
ncbi:MAG: MFS transporter, partial [candidate division NC10 bacterium]